MFFATFCEKRSECAIFPNTRPQGEVMPSMAEREPLGLKGCSMVGAPEGSQYWVAIWPFAASWSMTCFGAKNLPSLWETGTVWISPAAILASQGEELAATRVWTYWEMWR